MLKENLTQVEEKIDAACRRAGRDRSEVTLIAVSKTKPVSTLKEAYDPRPCIWRKQGAGAGREIRSFTGRHPLASDRASSAK